MANDIDSTFLAVVNENLGIAHKIARVYFDDPIAREDVVQEMMFQLWRSYPSFDNRSKFSTWMYRVCLNTALTHFARSKRMPSERLAEHHHNIPDVESSSDDMDAMLAAIRSLSKINRAIVLLYLEGMSHEEIGSVTGLSQKNVGVRLFRIRKELSELVNRQTQ
ncbi:sigma-70 family RNA polymerase sigma factor [Chryseolinea sp. T2]|uniref:RNA polymerase sigma factor n=1 Tax=Chryseolinea sp. T2 TaxID=3129255 RepID=UPI0030778A2F